MKREDLEKLGLDKDTIDAIMALHGRDIETHKTGLSNLQGQVDTLNKQLQDANSAIDGFKKLDVDGIKKAAEDWEAKAKQFETDLTTTRQEAEKKVKDVEFSFALKDALKAARAKDPDDIIPRLDRSKLELKDGKVSGLEDLLKPLQEQKGYLFEPESDPTVPRIVSKSGGSPVVGDKVVDAAREAAGLVAQKA